MSFNGIKGQDQAISLLKAYLAQGRLSGGYLFIGPEGIGKKLAAKSLAKALNCPEGDREGCGLCASCLKIEKDGHPDVHVIAGEDAEIKIESIRQLQRDIGLKPYEGQCKVFVIDNAHKLNPESSNALLKILEETPKSSLIILITDKPGFLFKTVVSRCKAVRFNPLAREELEAIMKNDYGFDINRAHFLAYFAEGRLGRALSLKDTDIIRRKNEIFDRFVLSPRVRFEGLPLEDRQDVRLYLNMLAAWFRDIYLVKCGIRLSEVVNFDRRNELPKMAERFSFADLNGIMDTITTSIAGIEQNINIRLLLHNLGAQLWRG